MHPPRLAATPRVDLYGPMHQGLRLFMNDCLQRLGLMDAADEGALRAGLAQLGELLSVLRCHLQQENDFLHPALEARAAGASRELGAEHEQQLAAMEVLELEAQLLAALPGALREPAARRLYRQLALFIVEQLLHMQTEESCHNPQLWAGYRDEELRALQGLMLASMPAPELTLLRRWMPG